MELIQEIKRLQEIERRYNNIQDKLTELGDFICDWDSCNPDRLPVCHLAKINPVRGVYNFCKTEK